MMTKMMIAFLSAFCLLGLTKGNEQKDYQWDDPIDYDYDDDYQDDNSTHQVEENEILEIPVITTKPLNIVTDVGTSFRLPCMMDNLPAGLSVIWRRPDTKTKDIITTGDTIINAEYKKRVEIEISNRGSILIVGAAKVEDAGEYECDLGVQKHKHPTSVTHTVSIRVAPSIISDSEAYIETEAGKDVVLECKGTGTPTPTVKWTKAKGKMPDGRAEVLGEKLVISNVNRHHAGHYKCTAHNGFSKSASKEIEVRVMYKPEILVEEVFIHTRAGNKAELVCSVHGFPRPEVTWTKDGQPIVQKAQKIKIQNINHKHSLIVSSVAKSDFGLYACHATSDKGTASKTLEISGLAGPADFSSDPAGSDKKSYVLDWTVVSYTPVTSFRVDTRILGTTAWTEHTVTPNPDGAYHFKGKLFLKEIPEAERFEARVLSRNEEGWNKPNKMFNFATLGAEPKQEGVTGGSTTIVPSILIAMLAAKLIF